MPPVNDVESSPGRWPARRRGVLISGCVVFLLGLASPVHAGNGTPPPSVGAAQAQVAQAQAQTHATDSALANAQQTLASAQAQLASIQAQVNHAQAVIEADQLQVTELRAQALRDRQLLGDFLRQSYQRGPSPDLAFILQGTSLGDIMQRAADASRVRGQGDVLITKVQTEEAGAQAALDDATKEAARLAVLQAQAATMADVLSIQEENLAQAAAAAHATLGASLSQLHAAQAAAAAAAAPPPPPPVPPVSNPGGGVTFQPVNGASFTVDTDLTQPSGMTADEINSFLNGTALAGLGQSYIDAEHSHHVSARYLVAHSIEESAWGTSAIAQDKHNLFGFGANDANPYGDAMTFASYDACIQFVATFVASHYLSPSGPYFHGPTLRGMNVAYASDPLWSFKIAKIAARIP